MPQKYKYKYKYKRKVSSGQHLLQRGKGECQGRYKANVFAVFASEIQQCKRCSGVGHLIDASEIQVQIQIQKKSLFWAAPAAEGKRGMPGPIQS